VHTVWDIPSSIDVFHHSRSPSSPQLIEPSNKPRPKAQRFFAPRWPHVTKAYRFLDRLRGKYFLMANITCIANFCFRTISGSPSIRLASSVARMARCCACAADQTSVISYCDLVVCHYVELK
jgi:hypothetical protein